MSLEKILSKVEIAKEEAGRLNDEINVIAVSKVQPLARIKKVLEQGHRVFGENRGQESLEKWPKLINEYGEVELHLVGALQTNKVKQVADFASEVHSLDRLDLAEKLDRQLQKRGRELKTLIQVNSSNEPQKYGISIDDAPNFANRLRHFASLKVVGLMTLALSSQDQFTEQYNLRIESNPLQEDIDKATAELESIME